MWKKRSVVTLAICLWGAFSLWGGGVRGDDEIWRTDFEAAKRQAKTEKKLLLVDFTGSDWCPPCKMLKQEVFDTETFRAEAPKKFVLVELDFPRTFDLPEELQAQNERLAKQFGVQSFPTVLVLDAEGQRVAKTSGYRRGLTPEIYVQQLAEFVTAHQDLIALRQRLPSLQGLERAKLLDQIVVASEKLDADDPATGALIREILTLDDAGQAGLKPKYLFRSLLGEVKKLKAEGKFAEALAVCLKARELPSVTAEQKQDIRLEHEGECHFRLKDFVGVIACLNEARAAAPESSRVPQIESLLERFSPIADAQQTIAKIQERLASVEGLERAKLLDQLIEAEKTFGLAVRDPQRAQNIAKWTKEILTLDADNQAGLKAKYAADSQETP